MKYEQWFWYVANWCLFENKFDELILFCFKQCVHWSNQLMSIQICLIHLLPTQSKTPALFFHHTDYILTIWINSKSMENSRFLCYVLKSFAIFFVYYFYSCNGFKCTLKTEPGREHEWMKGKGDVNILRLMKVANRR